MIAEKGKHDEEILALRLRDVFVTFIADKRDQGNVELLGLDKERFMEILQTHLEDPVFRKKVGLNEDELQNLDLDNLSDEKLERIKRISLEAMELDMNLMNELGMDSIEAFEAVSALHELINTKIPEDLDPSSITNFRSMAKFMLENYTEAQIEIILSEDFPEKIKEKVEANTIEDDFEGEF